MTRRFLKQEFQLLREAGVVVDPYVVHAAETDLAIVAAIREIITDKENLIKRVAMLGGIT